MADVYICTGNGVRIRSGAGTNFGVIGSLYKGNTVNVVGKSGNWCNIDSGGWVSATYLQLQSRAEENTTSPAAETVTETANVEAVTYRQEVDFKELTDATEYDDYPNEEVAFTTFENDNEAYLNDLEDYCKVETTRGIHGMPYQFLPVVDQRIDGKPDSFGRKYAEKIVSRMPILFLTPGIPKFMQGFKKNSKIDVLEKMLHMGHGSADVNMDSVLKRGGRYYTFEMCYTEYFKYADTLCRSIAYYLGIEDEKINGVKLKKFSWLADTEDDLSKIVHYTKGVAFYINSDKQISESYSNSTGESSIAQSVNGLSSYAREAQFILGGLSASTGFNAVGNAYDRFTGSENLNQNIENVNEFIDKIMLGHGGIFSRLTSNVQTLVAGGKLIFPSIWEDSGTDNDSYDINLKLVCPDPTPIGLYLDIMVPMSMLICLAVPRAATANGYVSPFLVRGYYKGMFNCDMGIITRLSFTKGAEGSWTREGIPTVVDVSFSIKDLYSALTISNNSKESGVDSHISNNIALLDWMANLCGINVNESDITRQIAMYLSTQSAFSRIRDDLRYGIFYSFEQWKDKLKYNIYSKLFR